MKHVLFAATLALAWIPVGAPASAAQHPHMCTPYAEVKAIVEGWHQTIISLTGEQFNFLRGIFTLDPNTAAGLPYGDKAVWIQRDDDGTALVFFLDGDKACDAFDLSRELVQMTMFVASGEINHAPAPGAGFPPT